MLKLLLVGIASGVAVHVVSKKVDRMASGLPLIEYNRKARHILRMNRRNVRQIGKIKVGV